MLLQLLVHIFLFIELCNLFITFTCTCHSTYTCMSLHVLILFIMCVFYSALIYIISISILNLKQQNWFAFLKVFSICLKRACSDCYNFRKIYSICIPLYMCGLVSIIFDYMEWVQIFVYNFLLFFFSFSFCVLTTFRYISFYSFCQVLTA